MIIAMELLGRVLRTLSARKAPLVAPRDSARCSIVMVTWEGKDLLAQSLPSLLDAVRFHSGEHEIIVVDNGSTDGTEEFLRGVPNALREAAMALGASKWKTIATVIVPAAYRGILTAVLLAFARVAGETAPLLFTALGNRFWSPGWNQPTASLPVMIFTYAIAPYDDWHRQAWAAGLVLLGLILVINIVARAILSRGIAVSRS